MAVDKSGNVVFDNGGTKVIEYNSAGNFVKQIDGTFVDNSQPFGSVEGLGFDSKGDLFVADSRLNRVTEYDSNLNYIQTIGAGITTGASSLNEPFGLVLDSNDNLFVGDRGNQRIVEFSPPSGVPEPSSLLLCGLLGAASLVGYLWRRSRHLKIAEFIGFLRNLFSEQERCVLIYLNAVKARIQTLA